MISRQEGTNIAVGSPPLQDEDAVAAAAEKLMAECGGTVFVLCSSTNEPRVRALHAACARTGRRWGSNDPVRRN